jgi:hypothetical protein
VIFRAPSAEGGAVTCLRGTLASTWHRATRLAFDQTFENATGAGAPPTSWPGQEQLADVRHKAAYSFVTGTVADRYVPTRSRISAWKNQSLTGPTRFGQPTTSIGRQ